MAEEAELETFSLQILVTVRSQQLQNGLRYGDHQRYRGYCSRRLHRVRRATKTTCGRGRFTKRPVRADTAKDERALLIPLVSAERAWAHAMELRSARTDGSTSSGLRQRMLRKLKRAVHHAVELEALAKERATEDTAREASAYLAHLRGTLAMEAGKHADALSELVAAKNVYGDVLAGIDDPAEKRIVRDLAEELQPSIDYCSFRVQGGEGAGAGASTVSSETAKLKEKLGAAAADDKDGEPVEWLGITIRLRNPRVVEALAEARAAQEALRADSSGDKPIGEVIGVFDGIIKHFNDARASLRAGNKKLPRPHDDAELDALDKYIRSLETEGVIFRTQLMFADAKRRLSSRDGGARETDVVRICDSLSQYVHDLASLKGIVDPGTTPCAETARILSIRSERAAHLAKAFAEGDQFAEALALVDRAAELAEEAKSMYASVGVEPAQVPGEDLADAERSLKALRCVVVARYNIRDAELTREIEDKAAGLDLRQRSRRDFPSLAERLSTFDAAAPGGDPRLADFPPQPRPVPQKPLNFDLAWERAHYPTRALDLRSRTGAGVAPDAGEDSDGEEAGVAASAPAASGSRPSNDGSEDGEEEGVDEAEEGKKGGWFSFWR